MTKLKRYYTTTDFWTKVKDSCAIGTFLTEAGLIVGDSTDTWKGVILALGAIGYLLGIWFKDENKDGTIDMFQ